MPSEPARPTIRLAQAAGLTLYVVTLAVLVALLVTLARKGVPDGQHIALLASTAASLVAVGGMGWDAVDQWLRGRKMTPHGVKVVRTLVFVAVLAALGISFPARTMAPVLILAPAMIVYLFVARRPAAGAAAGSRAGSGGGRQAARAGSPGSAKPRQRRGGKKRK